jgi:hypothetical protein
VSTPGRLLECLAQAFQFEGIAKQGGQDTYQNQDLDNALFQWRKDIEFGCVPEEDHGEKCTAEEEAGTASEREKVSKDGTLERRADRDVAIPGPVAALQEEGATDDRRLGPGRDILRFTQLPHHPLEQWEDRSEQECGGDRLRNQEQAVDERPAWAPFRSIGCRISHGRYS